MEITAATEAMRLHLYHLASLFFHEKAEFFAIDCKESENSLSITLKKDGMISEGTAQKNKALHIEASRTENAALGNAFFRASRAFTEYIPPYGLLFGVRPVKVPLFYLKGGHTAEQTKDILEKEFLVSREKTKLLLSLAETENQFEQSLPRNAAMLYLSIPFCPTRCRYCSFISSAAPAHLALIPQYVEQMKEEIRATADLFHGAGKTLCAIYMGGGTPGILEAHQLKEILSLVRDHFDLKNLREFCVEVGRPDTVTEEKLSVLKEMGVDRISINPQTTKDETLRRIGRGHSAEDFFRAMEMAKSISFSSVNCDLIAGLEGEEPEDFLSSLEDVLSLSPQEVTLHALCKKRSAEQKEPPSYSRKWQSAMEMAHKTCINRSLLPYYLYRQKNAAADLENTGFATRGTMGIYNLAMMEDLCDIFACGAGGIGKILPQKRGERIRRFPGFKYPFEYLSHPERMKERLEEMKQFL